MSSDTRRAAGFRFAGQARKSALLERLYRGFTEPVFELTLDRHPEVPIALPITVGPLPHHDQFQQINSNEQKGQEQG